LVYRAGTHPSRDKYSPQNTMEWKKNGGVEEETRRVGGGEGEEEGGRELDRCARIV